jgi:pimeloyl-ACP methyl ester carboxylesterase
MPYADNDGISLYYETTGPAGDDTGPTDADPPEGTPDEDDTEVVVLVEGLGYGRWMWRWQRERLAEEGYRVVVWDNRGTGDSEEPAGPYTVEEMASDLEAVLAEAGVEHAHVVGASMGGMIAQQYALDYTSHGGEEANETPEETQARMFGVPDDADEREAIRYKMKPATTDEFRRENDEIIEDIVDWRLAGDASEPAREAQAAGVAQFDSSDRLGEIDVPVLVAHGTDDRVLPVENADLLYRTLSHVQLTVFEGGSHLFFIEQAEQVNDRLGEFLAHV